MRTLAPLQVYTLVLQSPKDENRLPLERTLLVTIPSLPPRDERTKIIALRHSLSLIQLTIQQVLLATQPQSHIHGPDLGQGLQKDPIGQILHLSLNFAFPGLLPGPIVTPLHTLR